MNVLRRRKWEPKARGYLVAKGFAHGNTLRLTDTGFLLPIEGSLVGVLDGLGFRSYSRIHFIVENGQIVQHAFLPGHPSDPTELLNIFSDPVRIDEFVKGLKPWKGAFSDYWDCRWRDAFPRDRSGCTDAAIIAERSYPDPLAGYGHAFEYFGKSKGDWYMGTVKGDVLTIFRLTNSKRKAMRAQEVETGDGTYYKDGGKWFSSVNGKPLAAVKADGSPMTPSEFQEFIEYLDELLAREAVLA